MQKKISLFIIDISPLTTIIAPVIEEFVKVTSFSNFTTTNVIRWCCAQALERNYYSTVKSHYKNSYPESIIYSAISVEVENYFFHSLPFEVLNLFNNSNLNIKTRGQNLFILLEP